MTLSGSATSASSALRAGYSRARRWVVHLIVTLALGPLAMGAEPDAFPDAIKPLLHQYCFECHSTAQHKGDLDLEQFGSRADALRRPHPWQQVIEQLALDEMPPKAKPQPSAAERERLIRWAKELLEEAAFARAGDPGPVLLRRLNNAEFTYTIRDLTGVDSLEPAREFPGDSAAGEGFMNTGGSLVMSPALVEKYLDAARQIAAHLVLLPSGLRFSSKTTRRDWTEELLGDIRALYRQFSDPAGGDKVNLQGIVFETNEGGRLPVERYLRAALTLQIANPSTNTFAAELARAAAAERLSQRYLAALWEVLHGPNQGLLLAHLRARWATVTGAGIPALARDIRQWQKRLWKFSSVGHLGKVGGPKSWMEAVNPLGTTQEFRLKLNPGTNREPVTIHLAAHDAGDGGADDLVVWQRPRLRLEGGRELLLRDTRSFLDVTQSRRKQLFASAGDSLRAAADADHGDRAAMARKHEVELADLNAWFDYLGIGAGESGAVELMSNQIVQASGYDFVQGWGSPDTPSLLANSSTQEVRIPGRLPGRSVAVHPSPTRRVAVTWRSPVTRRVRITAAVTHAHSECGNGVEWFLEWRRGQLRQRFAEGVSKGAKTVEIGPFESVGVRAGDRISLLIGPRDANHACDLTLVDLTLTSETEPADVWNLRQDVSGDILAGNPHAGTFGNDPVWFWSTEPALKNDPGTTLPFGSILSRWMLTPDPAAKDQLASDLQRLLASGQAQTPGDRLLLRQLSALGGPLLSRAFANQSNGATQPAGGAQAAPAVDAWSLDPALFGAAPDGSAVDPASLCVQAPSILQVRLPAELVEGAEFVTDAAFRDPAAAEASVQLSVTLQPPPSSAGPLAYDTPVLVNANSAAEKRFRDSFEEFRSWFPAALCYEKIVPVDEAVTLTLFHREDEPLCRLMLSAEQKRKLDQLWDELHFVSRDALTLVDVFEQLWQYATQDADPTVFEPLRQPIQERASRFRQRLAEAEPKHLEALLEFAARAFRRPLTSGEIKEVQTLYRRLREEEISHEEAIQLGLARVLVAPAFLYRLETPASSAESGPVSDWELATRLSYFLWASAPDAELRASAADGRLRSPAVLKAQASRMLRDERIRRLAREFASAWLHLYAFDETNEKSERHFPTFKGVRGLLSEESIRFFTDLFQNDRSVLNILDADYAFLNEPLAVHYSIPGVKGQDWRRVDGVRAYERGGVLGFGAILAQQSGASRTSPILRGNWVAEVLLGDKLPRPPKDVPRLPEDETSEDLTVRQLVEKHSSDARCANCHRRIDGYGFALESFDAIGRARERDMAGRPLDVRARVLDGSEVDGAGGLKRYLLSQKKDQVLEQFCRKLLGYALGRSVRLSDHPLLAEMQAQLRQHDYRFSAAVNAVITSRQFLEIRGRELADAD